VKRRAVWINFTAMVIPSLIQKKLGEIEIVLVLGELVKLDKADFHFLMTRKSPFFIWAKCFDQEISAFESDIQEVFFSGG